VSAAAEFRRKVLLVDDEPVVRSLLSLFLLRAGFEVFEAECGVKALAVIQEKRLDDLDLLLTDIRMPNMDGVALAERCKRYYPNLKVVFMSGDSAAPIPPDSPLHPCQSVPKPFRPEVILTAVLEALQ
jgi:two-component system cell cycle sensor histidine kinase/response regulator CckA